MAESDIAESDGEELALLGGVPVISDEPADWPVLDEAVIGELQRCMQSGDWGRYEGESVQRLSHLLGERTAADHCVTCSSGTAAVELALRGLRVGEGDEVVMSAYDFKANFQNAALLGATPVLIDAKPGSWQVDCERIEDAFSDRTRALIVSHLHGGLAPMKRIMQIAASHDVPVIEDVCQNPGAQVDGQEAGSWGDVAVFSFGGSKLLSAGRGGALVTRRPEVAQRIQLYMQRGNLAYPLSELQASVVLGQLESLDQRNQVRAVNARWLMELLNAVGGLKGEVWNDADQPAFYKLGLMYDAAVYGGVSRELFARAMRAEGVNISEGFRSLHRIHSKRRFRPAGELSNADTVDESILVLHHPVLLTDERAMTQIANAARKIREHAVHLREANPAC